MHSYRIVYTIGSPLYADALGTASTALHERDSPRYRRLVVIYSPRYTSPYYTVVYNVDILLVKPNTHSFELKIRKKEQEMSRNSFY